MSESLDAAWERLEALIQLTSGFWLGFVFSASPLDVCALRRRVEALLQTREERLLIRKLVEPGELQPVLPWLLSDPEPAKSGCTWIEAIRADPAGMPYSPWVRAWERFFLRVNERRDAFRARLRGGLVFAAHPEIKPLVREAAPDLWSVRSLVIDLDLNTSEDHDGTFASLTGHGVERVMMDPGPLMTSPDDSAPADLEMFMAAPSPALADLKLVGDESRTHPKDTLSHERETPTVGVSSSIGVAHRNLAIAERCLAEGRAHEAQGASMRARVLFGGQDLLGESRALWFQALAEELLEDRPAATQHVEQAILIRRRLGTEELPIEWIDMAARLALANGERERSATLYAEAETAVRSRLKERETTEALNDLRTILLGLGEARRRGVDLAAATDAFDEAVLLARRLRDVLGDSPQILNDLVVALNKLADVRHERGDIARAAPALEEALRLNRQIRSAVGDSQRGQRDFSIALTRVARIRRDMGDSPGAAVAFTEALEIRRRLLAAGETPQRLRDVVSCLDQLGELERVTSRFEDALVTFQEALSLDRRWCELTSDAPDALRALAVTHYHLGNAYRDAGDLTGAAASFRACDEIAGRLEALPDVLEIAEHLREVACQALAELQRAGLKEP